MNNSEKTSVHLGLTKEEAEKTGIQVEEVIVPGFDKAHYYPGNKMITIRLLADKLNETIIGVEITGEGDVEKRINVAKLAMLKGTKLKDLQNIDLTYAPPYNSAMDVFIHAVNMILNKIKGSAEGIMPEQLYEKLSQSDPNLLVIDVRGPEEFAEGHIPGAINVPLGVFKSKIKDFDKQKEYVLNCRIGKRSYLAYKKMIKMGFANVKHLDGGLIYWKYPVER